MTSHDESVRKQKKRKGIVPIAKRRKLSDCQIGDTVEFADGTIAKLTSWISGEAFGRFVVDEVNGEFEQLDKDASITRIKGYL